ncbi:MAG: 4'-phosphopantetheinyl transferase superfamily protein [Desulfovibrionaceae bacterium]|nr:4'-phosphopantetheinyl transferase superfamily protein [Desulfovibrionaceae bacterium]
MLTKSLNFIPYLPWNLEFPKPNSPWIDLWLLKSEPPLDPRLIKACLDKEDEERAKRCLNPKASYHFSCQRTKVKIILAAYNHLPPSKLHFNYHKLGKPYAGAYAFNLSHARLGSLLGLTNLPTLGLDIEAISRDPTLKSTLVFFTPTEAKILANLPNEEFYKAYFSLWVRKEAVIKANDLQLLNGLKNLYASPKPEETQVYSLDLNVKEEWICPLAFLEDHVLAYAIKKSYLKDLRLNYYAFPTPDLALNLSLLKQLGTSLS